MLKSKFSSLCLLFLYLCNIYLFFRIEESYFDHDKAYDTWKEIEPIIVCKFSYKKFIYKNCLISYNQIKMTKFSTFLFLIPE